MAHQSLIVFKKYHNFYDRFSSQIIAINNVRLQKEIVRAHFFILPDVQSTWRGVLKSIKVLFIQNIKKIYLI